MSGKNIAAPLTPLDDFLANPKVYNATAIAKFLRAAVSRSKYFIGDEISVTISVTDDSKSIKDVLAWCAENPQPVDKLSKAIDLMVSGWERAKMVELMESQAESNPTTT
jgi:hypothetical protein